MAQNAVHVLMILLTALTSNVILVQKVSIILLPNNVAVLVKKLSSNVKFVLKE